MLCLNVELLIALRVAAIPAASVHLTHDSHRHDTRQSGRSMSDMAEASAAGFRTAHVPASLTRHAEQAFHIPARLRTAAAGSPGGHVIMMNITPTTDVPRDVPRLFGTGPVLPVRDIAVSVAFYCDRLGFDLDFVMGKPPNHGSVTRGRVGIQFTNAPAAFDAATYPGWVHIFVDSIHALYDEYKRRSATFTPHLASHDYGMIEFELADPDGFRLRSGQYQ